MEEELNEHELEERLYAMLHHVDETQNNVPEPTQTQNVANNSVENAPRSTMRRYWRTGGDHYNPYQKINRVSAPVVNRTPPPPPPPPANVPKEERTSSPPTPAPDTLSIFQAPLPANLKCTVEILEHENNNAVVLESSDEDEVVEVALPPKPTITIESSDEDELQIVKTDSPAKTPSKVDNKNNKSGERAVSASPVPSVVSSVSDEFIRGDCIALNISSRQPDNPSFDFSLHGTDLLIQDTPSKKRKKKKSKELSTSTPVVSTAGNITNKNTDACFATPKSKARNKKQADKSFIMTDKHNPNIDIYDSDSNQSIADANKNKNPYIVTNKSVPSFDVYESDSSQSEVAKDNTHKVNDADSSDSCTSNNEMVKNKKNDTQPRTKSNGFVDLTGNDSYNCAISENIVMGNVTGFDNDSGDENDVRNADGDKSDLSKFVSSKVPSILNEDLDFDNLKGKDMVCKNRRYSLTTLRAEMEKFYNESWGGEDFNHKEIQKYMSRDKNLWAIDPKDKMPSQGRKAKCNYCNRVGHRDDACRMKPPVCYMCGTTGHIEMRCPTKMCVNCGTPNQVYTNMCRACAAWSALRCAECGQAGHPHTHCPDLWRRYHNTIDINKPLEKCPQNKKFNQLYCSGCSRRGHLIHTCRSHIPFSGLPINSPYIFNYRSIFTPQKTNKQSRSISEESVTPQANKRQSKSPTAHENHLNKKRNISLSEDDRRQSFNAQKNMSVDDANKKKVTKTSVESGNTASESMPDFIPISSSNHDNKGQMIQDNEVSDTSDAITSSRIYVTGDVVQKLGAAEGKQWLADTCAKLCVSVQLSDISSFLNISGKVSDQEAFQLELREWNQPPRRDAPRDPAPRDDDMHLVNNIPKNRNNLLKKLDRALKSLNQEMGDPKDIFSELKYLQHQHQNFLKKKVISPKTLTNNRSNINNAATKLNTVLLGQAGLADGSRHVTELHSLKEQLENINNSSIPISLRKEIGQHYHNVFGPVVRNDYADLLKKYYVGKSASSLKQKKKKKVAQPKPNPLAKNSIPPQQTQPSNDAPVPDTMDCRDTSEKTIKSQTRELVFLHKRLVKIQLQGNQRKMKNELVRKLHTLIASLFKKKSVPSKILKKAMKTQAEAQKFLTNMCKVF